MLQVRIKKPFLCANVCAIAFGVAFLSAAPASAKESARSACASATETYKSAVQSEKAGHWRDAYAGAKECAQTTLCAGLMLKCTSLLDKLVSETPTIIPFVVDALGEPKVDVEVKMDGALLTSRLDGRGLPVDTGVHVFTFSTDAGVFATEKIMVFEGQRNRPIAVTIASTATAGAPEEAGKGGPIPGSGLDESAVADSGEQGKDRRAAPVGGGIASEKPASEGAASETAPPAAAGGGWALPRSPFPYVLGSLGLAGVASGALLNYWGGHDNTSLQRTCSPHCSQSSVDHIQSMYIAADVAYGAGAAALAVTAWLIASSRAETTRPTQAAATVDVRATPSGAFASVSGTF
jgi:hypothetical protein